MGPDDTKRWYPIKSNMLVDDINHTVSEIMPCTIWGHRVCKIIDMDDYPDDSHARIVYADKVK